MLDGVLEMVPWAKVLHIGIFREKTTLQPIEYYNKLPQSVDVDLCVVLDPMIATSGTVVSAVNLLKEWGAPRIRVISVCSSRPGLEKLRNEHPDIEIFTACIDDELTEHGYISPGMGDAGGFPALQNPRNPF